MHQDSRASIYSDKLVNSQVSKCFIFPLRIGKNVSLLFKRAFFTWRHESKWRHNTSCFTFFPGTLRPSQEEVPRHASTPGQLWCLCSSSSTHRCQRTRNISRTWPRLSNVVTQINCCHGRFASAFSVLLCVNPKLCLVKWLFKIPLQAVS